MQKGNKALCEASFDWEKVDQVELHDDKGALSFQAVHYCSIVTSFGPATFYIAGKVYLLVQCNINVENFGQKARQLVSLAYNPCDDLK